MVFILEKMQVAVQQRFEEVATTQGPTTTTTSTTPRPPYVYTYDKNKVINEIFSVSRVFFLKWKKKLLSFINLMDNFDFVYF